MTDKTPATEAGRRLDAKGPVLTYEERHADILAIEAEAREGCTDDEGSVYYEQGWKAGRADALREAAERVRALPIASSPDAPRIPYVSKTAVLAILEETGS